MIPTKCPHCAYQDFTQYFDGTICAGGRGDFFKLSTVMTRPLKETLYRSDSVTAAICGCPSCYKTFIEPT